MKLLSRFNVNGEYVESVMIEDNEQIPTDCTEIELPQPNWKPVFQNGEWVETMSQTELIEPLKQDKMEELEGECDEAIIAGFDYTINNIPYKFSCSLAAQANFQGTDTLFKDGTISQAEWTVINNETGATERITFAQDVFNNLKLQVFQHINNNISKLRNTLQPQVEEATTQAELEAIVW